MITRLLINYFPLNKLIILISFCASLHAYSQDGFSVNQSAGCAPLVSTFTYTAGANPTFISWNFGNSNTLSGNPNSDPGLLNPTMSYLNPGSYTVSLEVTNDNGTQNFETVNYITVYEDPTVNFEANITEGCGSFAVSFTNLSTPGDGAITQWNWDFGDAGSSNLENPIHVYSTPGTYDVSLSATDVNGCNTIFTIQDYIVATDGVYPSFELSSNSSCEIPTTITITNNSTGAGNLTYDWNFGNFTSSSSANPSPVVYENAGTYVINLTLSNDLGCTQNFTQFLSIQEYTVDFSADLACLPAPSLFINESDPILNTFLWDFGDPASGSNNTSSSALASHLFSAPGTYNVTLTASNNGECESSYSMEVTVNQASEIELASPEMLICNFPTEIPIEVNNADIASYQWFVSLAGGSLYASGNENNTTLSFENYPSNLEEGNYNLIIQAEFENGCTGYMNALSQFVVDSINFTTSVNPQFLCLGSTSVATDNTNFIEDIVDYNWDWGDTNTSSEQEAEHSYTSTGTYILSLSLFSESGCSADTSMIIEVGEHTFPDFTYPDTAVCINEAVQFTFTGSGNIDAYYWSYNSNQTSQDPSPLIEIKDIDSTHVITLVTENNGCLDTMVQVVNIIGLGPDAEFSIIPPKFCKEEIPYTPSFLNTTDSTENTGYRWVFQDSIPDFLGTTPIEIEFFEPGFHPITLIATDSVTGCETEQTHNLYIDLFNIHFTDSLNIDACDTYLLNGSAYYTNIEYLETTPDDTIVYNWDFGDGYSDFTSTGNKTTLEHEYSEPGNYYLRVYAENQIGCPDTIAKWVDVHPHPQAAFTLDDNICPPAFVDVNNASIEMDTTIISYNYALSLTDTVYYSDENPTIYIESPLNYILSLAIVDGFGCRDTSYQLLDPHIIIMDYYLPDFLCYTTEYTIENNISSAYLPLDFLWEFGNGLSTTEESPTLSFNDSIAPSFLNYITVSDATGCTQVDSFYIQISDPTFDYTFLTDEAACPPIYSDFSITSNFPINTYSIDYGDGELNTVNTIFDAMNMSHVYDLPGIYNVNFSVVDIYGCVADTTVDSLVVVPGPWASFTFNPLSGCPPLDVTFNIEEEDNVSDYLWVFGDGYTSTLQNPSHTYTLAGTFTPILLVQDSIDLASGDSIPCIVTILGEELIIDGPILDFLVINDTLCFGDGNGVQLENLIETVPGFEISSVTWDFGDGFTSTDFDPEEHLYQNPGWYTITLSASTENGCEYVFQKENAVYVMDLPQISPFISYSPSCPPMMVEFYGDTLQNTVSDIHYNWIFGDGDFSSEEDVIHSYEEEGSYYPELSISYFNCSFEASLNEAIETYPVPDALIQASPLYANSMLNEILLSDQSIDAASVSWYVNGQYFSDEAEITLNAENDSLLVYLIAFSEQGCPDTAWFSLNDFSWDIPNVITPNGDGNNDFFVLNFKEFGPCIDLSIYNRWGSLIYQNANYQDDWYGENQSGQEVSDGTYFYIINVCSKTSTTGYITVIH